MEVEDRWLMKRSYCGEEYDKSDDARHDCLKALLMEDERTDSDIWHDALEKGIVLVPFEGLNGFLVAAVREEDLIEACRRADLDHEDWEDIFSLGLGFFVEVGAPGNGEDRKTAYLEALQNFEELQPKAQWIEGQE